MGKYNQPLPWFLALMSVGILVVGTSTYLIVERPGSKTEIAQRTETVKRRNLTVRIKANGTVEPIQSVNISPKEPGRLVKLLVEQGQVVKQGQKLAVMENTELQAQGLEAQAQRQQAIANLNQAKVDIPGAIKQREAEVMQAQTLLRQAQERLKQAQASIPKQIEQAKGQLGSAQARYKLAGDRLQRYRYLLEQGAVTQDNFDEEENEYRRSEASLYEAQKRVEELQDTAQSQVDQLAAAVAEAQAELRRRQVALEQRRKSAQAEIQRLEAGVAVAEAQLKRIEIRFLDTIITAPFDGIVTQKYATEGAFVTPTTSASSTASATSTSILALARGLEVIAKVPEVDIGQIFRGQKVEVTVDAYPQQTFQGQVVLVAPEAIVEQNVTSFEVRIALLTGQGQLRSKMNADVTFLGKTLENAVVVPTVAIVTQEGQTGVMVADETNNNRPLFKPVIIGLTIDNQTQILSGLNVGENFYIELPPEYQKKPRR